MSKKVIIYSVILVWLAVLLQLVVIYGLKNDNKITEAFLAGESVPAKSTLTVTAEYGTVLVSREEKRQLLSYVADGLKLTSYRYQEGKQTISSINDKAETKIQYQVQGDENQGSQRQIVTTTIVLTDHIESIISLKEIICKSYEALNMKPQCYLSMEGSYEGELDEERILSMQETIFKVLESRKIKEQKLPDNSDGSQSTIFYGYTKRLDIHQMLNGQKMNTQLIYTYHEKENRTYMNLAIPYYNEDF